MSGEKKDQEKAKEQEEKKKRSPLQFLLSPWTILLSVVLGTLIGWRFPETAHELSPFGSIYLSLLQMCALPILITAVVTSLGKLLASGQASFYIRRIVLIFGLGITMAVVIGIGLGAIGEPGSSLSEEQRGLLGKLLAKSDLATPVDGPQASGLVTFLHTMVPANLFRAVSEGQNLAVIFFCILFGISLGLVRSSGRATTLAVTEALFDALLRIIKWLMYALPIGLICLFAHAVSEVGIDILSALGRFVVLCLIGAVVLMAIYLATMSWALRLSPWKVLSALKEPIFVGLGTSSGFATIPFILLSLEKKLNVNKSVTNLVSPMSVNLNPQATVFYFALAVVFIAQLYGRELLFADYFVMIVGSILGGMAATGVPFIVGLSLLGIILGPLGLPTETAIVLLIAVDPILDPILTVVNVGANATGTILVASGTDGMELTDSVPEIVPAPATQAPKEILSKTA